MSAASVAEELLGLLIPLYRGYLLLPNAAVAEVIGYREADPGPRSPSWLPGEIQWRRENTPVISFERLAGLAWGEPGHRARICIVNTLGENTRIPYFGVVAQGIPRLVRVSESNVRPLERDTAKHGVVRQWVNVAGEDAMIPDLEVIEKQLLEAMAPRKRNRG